MGSTSSHRAPHRRISDSMREQPHLAAARNDQQPLATSPGPNPGRRLHRQRGVQARFQDGWREIARSGGAPITSVNLVNQPFQLVVSGPQTLDARPVAPGADNAAAIALATSNICTGHMHRVARPLPSLPQLPPPARPETPGELAYPEHPAGAVYDRRAQARRLHDPSRDRLSRTRDINENWRTSPEFRRRLAARTKLGHAGQTIDNAGEIETAQSPVV